MRMADQRRMRRIGRALVQQRFQAANRAFEKEGFDACGHRSFLAECRWETQNSPRRHGVNAGIADNCQKIQTENPTLKASLSFGALWQFWQYWQAFSASPW